MEDVTPDKRETGRLVFSVGAYSALVWFTAVALSGGDAAWALGGACAYMGVTGLIGGGIGLYRMGKAKGKREING